MNNNRCRQTVRFKLIGFLRSLNMTLQVSTFGSGPDLALLHGWGLGRGVWYGIPSRLSSCFRVHLISLPGYDNSAADTRDFEATASAIAETLPAGTTLCGWSMGGMLALTAAAYHPGHFARLVLVGTTPKFIQAIDWTPAQTVKSLDAFLRWVSRVPEDTLASFITLLSRSDCQAEYVSNCLEALLGNEIPATSVLEKGLIWLRDMDLRRLIKQVEPPTLIVHGDQDPVAPAAAALWLAVVLPHARLRLCADTAHAPFVSDPDHFCSMLTNFCSEPI